jgi:exonuclease V gamma subunit
MDRLSLHLAIFAHLVDPAATMVGAASAAAVPAQKQEEPIRDYLLAATEPHDYTRRAWQVAGKLAGSFMEYECQREKMVNAWRENKALADDPMELAQKDIYKKVVLENTGNQTLFSYERSLKSLKDDKCKPPVHMFGVSIMAPFHARLLYRLAREAGQDFVLYETNPCAEFWEDVTTTGEDRWRKSWDKIRAIQPSQGELKFHDTILPENAKDPVLLKRWGKLGREKVKMLSVLEEGALGTVEFQSDWTGEMPDCGQSQQTVLREVQDRILMRKGSGKKLAQDTSIQVAGCPGMVREVETVYNSIIRNMSQTPDLRLTDIAILVTDMATYKPVLQSVFGRQSSGIPYNLTDSAAVNDSLYAQAFLKLLDLMDSDFSRREVFDLVFNSCFLARHGLEREDADQWLAWAESLGVFRNVPGPGKEDEPGNAVKPFSWTQAFARLRFGRISDATGNGLAFGTGQNSVRVLPFQDLESRNRTAVLRFCSVLEPLMARLRELRVAGMAAGKWATEMKSLLDDTLAVPRERAPEAFVMRSLLGSLDQFGKAFPDGQFGFHAVAEYMKGQLVDIPCRVGAPLTGGVTISSMRSLRMVPFRLVYVMGLGEGCFPRAPERFTLDLRLRSREIGDVSSPDLDRYVFLETLLATRDKLYLTYVCKDTRNDKEFYPCSVVNELEACLEAEILKEESAQQKAEFRRMILPLNAYSDVYFKKDTGAEGDNTWSDVLVSYSSLDASLAAEIRKAGAAGQAAESSVEENLSAAPAVAQAAKTEVTAAERVTLRQLKTFLENPAKAMLRRHLGLYDDEGDNPDAEFEPVTFEDFSDANIEAAVIQALAEGRASASTLPEVEALVGVEYEKARLHGLVPPPAFAVSGKKKMALSIMSHLNRKDGLMPWLAQRKDGQFIRNVCLGAAALDGDCGMKLPAVRFDGIPVEGARTVTVEVVGSLPVLWVEKETYWTLCMALASGPSAKPSKENPISKFWLQAQLFSLACLADRHAADGAPPVPEKLERPGDIAAGRALQILTLYKGGSSASCKFVSTPAEADGYMRRLLSAYLSVPPMFDLLPLKTIVEKSYPAAAETADVYRRRLEEGIESAEDSWREDCGDAPVIEDVIDSLAVPANALDKVKERIVPLSQWASRGAASAPVKNAVAGEPAQAKGESKPAKSARGKGAKGGTK